MPRKKAAVSMQNRLRHLESLVKNVMSKENPLLNGASPRNSDGQTKQAIFDDEIVKVPINQQLEIGAEKEPSPPASTARIVQGLQEATYVGATHWGAILEDVSLESSRKVTTTNSLKFYRLKKLDTILTISNENAMPPIEICQHSIA